MTSAIKTLALAAELSRLAGHPVDLVARTLDGGRTVWIVRPVEQGRLGSRFWTLVRAESDRGAYGTPEQAVVGFASRAKVWVAKSAAAPPGAVEAFLQERLAGGPVAAAVVLAEAAALSISRDRVDRAARRMGVARRKDGLEGGWLWSLAAEARTTPSIGVKAATNQGTT